VSLSPAQEEHLNKIVVAFSEAVIAKYEAGAREHGGNLWEKSALEIVREAKHEAIDQFVYLTTLEEKLKDV